MRLTSSLICVCALSLAACGSPAPDTAEPAPEAAATPAPAPEPAAPGAMATIAPASGSTLTGTATFTTVDDGVMLNVLLENATPGMHAVHLHETGDCSAADATSAGGHWNPTNQDHGQWGVEPFHLGDIGNVEVNDEGEGSLELTTDLWSLAPGADNSVLGRAIVVHAGADDFTSQPAGAAGPRVGCGVVVPD